MDGSVNRVSSSVTHFPAFSGFSYLPKAVWILGALLSFPWQEPLVLSRFVRHASFLSLVWL